MTRRRDVKFIFGGPQAPVLMDMIQHMAEYLAGPGLPGFTSWIDQRTKDLELDVTADPAKIQQTLFRLAGNIEGQLSEYDRKC